MGKRAVLAFALSLLVIMSFNYFMAKMYPLPAPAVKPGQRLGPAGSRELMSEKTGTASSSQQGSIVGSRMPAQPAQDPAGALSPSQLELASKRSVESARDIVVETDLMLLVLTSSGARIKSCRLKQYGEEKFTPAEIESQIQAIDTSLSKVGSDSPAYANFLREKEKQQILYQRLQQGPKGAEIVSLAAVADADFAPAINLNDQAASLRINTAHYEYVQPTLSLNPLQPEGKVQFNYLDSQGRQVKKVYSFANSSYYIGLEIELHGWQKPGPTGEYFLLSCGPGIGTPQAVRSRRVQAYQGPLTYYSNGQRGWIQKEKYTRAEQSQKVRREHAGKVGWAGLENKYFLTALIPHQTAQSVVVHKNIFGEHKVALKTSLQASASYNFSLYMGPKQESHLKASNVSLEQSIDYGFFGPIARALYLVLVFFSRWTHNFGWAIVLLCVLTKVIFYPLTHRSFEAMQRMQEQMKTVQPEMDALRQEFKDNPQKLNKEVMALYRKRGINPLASCQSGCLPLLLQMPIFFALYAVLYNSIELRGTPFLGWIKDLSAKDPYYVLPVLMGISMFLQQKLTGMGGATGTQQDQAKLMAVMMPIFLTWIFASLPAGVVLYWFTFNVVTALQQLIIKKKQVAAAGA